MSAVWPFLERKQLGNLKMSKWTRGQTDIGVAWLHHQQTQIMQEPCKDHACRCELSKRLIEHVTRLTKRSPWSSTVRSVGAVSPYRNNSFYELSDPVMRM